jgi:hypothetical protein
MADARWTINQLAPAAHAHRVEINRNSDWEHWMLLTSDRHLDNPLSNQKMQRKHLAQAKERGAAVFDFGDLFCAMQGKQDRRGNKGSVRKEDQQAAYYDSIVDHAEDFLYPYRDNLALFGPGNHEDTVLEKQETDLTRRLVRRLQKGGSPVQEGGLRGWLRIMFLQSGTQSTIRSFNMYYHHGHGGGGPVTRGVIQTNRRAVYLPDADFVIGGHIHESWIVEVTRARLLASGQERPDTQIHACLPAYKEEFIEQRRGWHHSTGKPPKPVGAWWIRFYWERPEVKFDFFRAK